MQKKKILITGASGFLGYHLLRSSYAKDFEVFGLYNSGTISFDESTNLQLDLRNYIDMGNIIDDIEPDIVIHAAALTDANLCQMDKELSYELNVEVTRNLAGICCDYQVPFVFTSTDLVFDGTRGNYSEEDTPNPLMVYGEHKLLAEREVERIYPSALIARCPLMFGALEASNKNYFSNFVKGLRDSKSSKLFDDEFRSVCGGKSIAEGLLHLCEEVSGIVHLAGPDRVSRYDFGVAIADEFHLDKNLLESCSQKDVQLAAPRPADVSLNIQKAVSLGYSPLNYQVELKQIASRNYLNQFGQ
jgi:dTDP-4-dehydrorhamnose reductase